jgi:hypothetical protein
MIYRFPVTRYTVYCSYLMDHELLWLEVNYYCWKQFQINLFPGYYYCQEPKTKTWMRICMENANHTEKVNAALSLSCAFLFATRFWLWHQLCRFDWDGMISRIRMLWSVNSCVKHYNHLSCSSYLMLVMSASFHSWWGLFHLYALYVTTTTTIKSFSSKQVGVG